MSKGNTHRQRGSDKHLRGGLESAQGVLAVQRDLVLGAATRGPIMSRRQIDEKVYFSWSERVQFLDERGRDYMSDEAFAYYAGFTGFLPPDDIKIWKEVIGRELDLADVQTLARVDNMPNGRPKCVHSMTRFIEIEYAKAVEEAHKANLSPISKTELVKGLRQRCDSDPKFKERFLREVQFEPKAVICIRALQDARMEFLDYMCGRDFQSVREAIVLLRMQPNKRKATLLRLTGNFFRKEKDGIPDMPIKGDMWFYNRTTGEMRLEAKSPLVCMMQNENNPFRGDWPSANTTWWEIFGDDIRSKQREQGKAEADLAHDVADEVFTAAADDNSFFADLQAMAEL